MADEDKTGVYTVERIVEDGSYAHSVWTTVMADCAEDAVRIATERTKQGETLHPATEEPDGETVLVVRAESDGIYTVERIGHAIAGWTTVTADSAEEAAMIVNDRVSRGELLEQDGEPDGEPVLVVRAVAGFYGRIADDLADAIR